MNATPDEIVESVLSAAHVSWHEMFTRNRYGSLCRHHEITDARAAAVVLMRDLLGTSWGLIARRLGLSCHSSAVCAYRRKSKPSVARLIERARQELERHATTGAA